MLRLLYKSHYVDICYEVDQSIAAINISGMCASVDFNASYATKYL